MIETFVRALRGVRYHVRTLVVVLLAAGLSFALTTTIRRTSVGASSSGSPWPVHSPTMRRSFWPTSRTGNLDGETSQQVIDLIHSMARERGLCVVVVTHNPAIAAAADRVIRLDYGRIHSDHRNDGTGPRARPRKVKAGLLEAAGRLIGRIADAV
jgi:hypothetical protein